MIVIDASAVLAILQKEHGAEVAAAHAQGALMSTVNLSELLAKASENGLDVEEVADLIRSLEIEIVAFDEEQSLAAAALRPATRFRDVSFADRACLALALGRRALLITGDTKWPKLDLGIDIRLIR